MADTDRLIAEVAARHRIRIDSGDPVFCVVTLSELILQDAARNVAADIRLATHEFESAAEKVQARTGTILAQQMTDALARARQCLENEVQAASSETTDKLTALHQSYTKFATHWISAGIVSGLLLFGVGVIVGWLIR
jgi:hypothetical protein